MSTPTPKVALITGGTKGIGAATALHLSKNLNFLVAVSYASDSSTADKFVTQLGGPSKAIAIKALAGSVADTTRLVQETLAFAKAHGAVNEQGDGKINVLIPNAADGAVGKSFGATSEEDFDRVIGTNIRGPFFLVQKAAPHMPSGGRVITLSTSLTNLSNIMPNYLLYVTTKGAVEQMTRVLAKDLGRRQITVNCVAPGPTGTDMFFEGKSEELVKMIASWNPMGRLGMPDEIAGAIGFLVGEGGTWVNGQVLRVNGGMTV
jgi:3-oxoacyl-[acyl-carrier protein] reductase